MPGRDQIWFWAPNKRNGVVVSNYTARKHVGESGRYTRRECVMLNRISKSIEPPQWIVPEVHSDNFLVDMKNRNEQREGFNNKIMSEFNRIKSQQK